MELTRLLAPRSVAVVGASTRPGSYGNQVMANLVDAGFGGPLAGVHPSATTVHGRACVPCIAELPFVPDAVVIATPAATVPELVAEAGAFGCGGAIVLAAGFGETARGAGLQERLRRAALDHDLPVCGPNGNGVVSVGRRAPMWGDSCSLRRAGPIALISQSGNVAVNALGSTRGLRLHTVISCGNQAVLDAADYLTALAAMDGVGAVALYLEAAGDGAKLAQALALCAERDIGVVVLKAGASPLGAAAAAAHTGSVAGDTRVLRALIEEAGASWVRNPHELLEVVKALGYGRRVPGTGAVIVTCSGGDAANGADEAARLGVPLPAPRPQTAAALRSVLPPTATATNPLDYTAVLFGEVEPTTRIVVLAGQDEGIGAVLVYYDRPEDLGVAAAASWDAALAAVIAAAAQLDKPVLVASTLPELMPEQTAETLVDHGIVPVAGLSEGVQCAAALLRAPGSAPRLRAIAEAARLSAPTMHPSAVPGRLLPAEADAWLAEHEAKALLRAAGVMVPPGRVVADADAAVAAALALGGPVAVKLSGRDIRHKTELGAVHIGLHDAGAVRHAALALRTIPGHETTPLLVEAMAQPGLELMIAVRRDGAIPVLVLAFGGIWVEVLDDAVLIPLPVDPAIVGQRIGELRGASLLLGGRGRRPADVAGLAALAVAVAGLAVTENLELVELNPVVVHPHGVTVVDAVMRRRAAAPDTGGSRVMAV